MKVDVSVFVPWSPDEFLHGAHPADEVFSERLLAPGSGARSLLPASGRHGLPPARRPPLHHRQQRQRHGDGRQGQLLRGLPGGGVRGGGVTTRYRRATEERSARSFEQLSGTGPEKKNGLWRCRKDVFFGSNGAAAYRLQLPRDLNSSFFGLVNRSDRANTRITWCIQGTGQ